MIRSAIENFGIYAWKTPPRGAHLFANLKSDLPHLRVSTVFDVGANIGQSIDEYVRYFRDAVIHSYEPVPSTFRMLQDRYGRHPRVHLHQVALGSSSGTAKMRVDNGTSDGFRIDDGGTEEVPMARIDDLGVGHINFLKIDTEGYDLEVVRGASGMITGQKIDVVQTEVGTHPDNSMHIRFEDMKAALEGYGMKLYSLIGQSPVYFPVAEPAMVRADAVFISDALIDRHRLPKRGGSA